MTTLGASEAKDIPVAICFLWTYAKKGTAAVESRPYLA